MDPYCKVELCKQQYKTKVHKKGGSQAKWEQSFTFTLLNVADKEVIHFQVWDEDILSDDKIGRADLPLSSLALYTDKKDGAWVQLVDFDNFKKIAGYIRVGVKFEGSGWPKEETSAPPPATITPPEPEKKHEEYKPEHKYIPVAEKKEEVKLTDRLPEDYCLKIGHRITSPDGKYTALMQYDGNFVVLRDDEPVWSTKTAGSGADLIQLQSDNNLVLLDISTGKPIPHWASETAGHGKGKSALVMQNDGNLVLYDGDGKPLWASGIPSASTKLTDHIGVDQALRPGGSIRSPNHEYTAQLGHDGNFSVIKGKGYSAAVIWSTKAATDGKGGARLTLQGDRNLVLYNASGAPVWATSTNGKGAGGEAKLVMQNDGNLVLYDGATPLWASAWHTGKEEKKSVSSLGIDQALRHWDQLVSPDGKWTATFHSDGNFVVAYEKHPKWSTRTQGHGATRITLQGDHNLVIYTPKGPIWSSNTAGKGSSAKLVIQDDGNLVLLDGTTVLWDRN
jgi:hypothetical protein